MRAFAFILVLAGSSSAQITTATTAIRDTILRTLLVTGMPYSAQQVTEHVQVLADGTRITQTREKQSDYRDSAGRTTTEHMAPQNPNITVLQTDSDPRSGDTTTSLTNISRAEPDPSLFQVPTDYQAVAPK